MSPVMVPRGIGAKAGRGEGLPVYSWRPADFEGIDGLEVVAVTLSALAGRR